MEKIIKPITFICLFFVLAGCSGKDEKIEWAQNLNSTNIERIEAIAMPSNEGQRYKEYDISEFTDIIEIVNNAKGKKIDNPESIVGGRVTFYITTTDGERHKFSNSGNIYLIIDGVSYKANKKWLYSWGDIQLNSTVPDDFVY